MKPFNLKRIRLIEISLILIVSLIPLFWYKTGYFYANGDDFPLFLNPHQTMVNGASLWTPNYLGSATPMPAYLLYQYLGAILSYIGLSAGSIQTLFLVSLFMLAGFSMFYLTCKIYPASKMSPFIASFFYLLNFFFLINLRNIGFRWTYAFLPLALALFYIIMTATFQGDKKGANKNIVYFALVSVLAFSFASINPANIALYLIGLSVLAFYFLFKFRRRVRPYLLSLAKIVGVTFPVNLWWIVPMLNSFVFSGQALNSQVSLDSWSWTHARASFLNLFWLNGSWNWTAQYFPYINSYTNTVLAVLVFVPFLIAGLALLFKSNKSRFNTYLMGAILIFLFLATGVHYLESLGQLNLWFYTHIPLMSMFREPVSKFTIVMLPFLALLVGFGSERIAEIKPRKTKIPYLQVLVSSFLAVILLVSVSPIVLDSMETKTSELDFSSQVKIPDYWYQATNWINSQPGDSKVLITPLDDFYQMPYTWGYYGTDQLLERLFEKAIVSTANLNGYVSNSNSSATLEQIRTSVKFNRTDEFKALLDLLSIKYIVQRNDVVTNLAGRNLMSPREMQVFFSEQPYLKIVETFGSIDIYEYIQAKPSIYTLSQSMLQQTDIHIDSYININKTWNFSAPSDIQDWANSTASNQSQASCLLSQSRRGQLQADMWNSTSSWITVNSPIMHADSESSYQISANFSARIDYRVYITIAEYSKNMTHLTDSSIAEIQYDDGTFDGWTIFYRFEPKNENSKYFQIQFWNHINTTESNMSSLLLNQVRVLGTLSTLNMTGIERIYGKTSQSPAVLTIQEVSPIKVVAAVNATQPFILATSQELDNSWVAYVNGHRAQPVSLYLGLKGFLVNATGQVTITLEYQPQLWFTYSIGVSAVSAIILFVGLVVLIGKKLRQH